MIKQKKKICAHCQEEKYIFKNISGLKYCKECSFIVKEKGSPKKKSTIKPKFRKPTGELELFKAIWEERGPYCQITGEPLEFSVWNFAHIISKGAAPELRLCAENIIIICPQIHFAFDNEPKEKVLSQWPNTCLLYELKESIKSNFYSKDKSQNQ